MDDFENNAQLPEDDFRNDPQLRPAPYMLDKPIEWPNFPIETNPEEIRGMCPRIPENYAQLQIREIAIRIYRHMKRTDIWHHFCCDGKNHLLYFIQRVDNAVSPMTLCPAKLRKNVDPGDMSLYTDAHRHTISLAYEDLYYMTCFQIILLYEDLKTRVSGLGYDLHWVMHQGGERAGPATEGQDFNMARMFWLLRNYWISLQSTDLVGAIDYGLSYGEEGEQLIKRAEWIRDWQPSHVSKIGMMNINAIPPFAISMAVWAREQKCARMEQERASQEAMCVRVQADAYQAKFHAKMQSHNLPFGAQSNDIASLHIANAALGGALKEGIDQITWQSRETAKQRTAHLKSWLEDQGKVKKFKSASSEDDQRNKTR